MDDIDLKMVTTGWCHGLCKPILNHLDGIGKNPEEYRYHIDHPIGGGGGLPSYGDTKKIIFSNIYVFRKKSTLFVRLFPGVCGSCRIQVSI